MGDGPRSDVGGRWSGHRLGGGGAAGSGLGQLSVTSLVKKERRTLRHGPTDVCLGGSFANKAWGSMSPLDGPPGSLPALARPPIAGPRAAPIPSRRETRDGGIGSTLDG